MGSDKNMDWQVKDVCIGLGIGGLILAFPAFWWVVAIIFVGYVMGAS